MNTQCNREWTNKYIRTVLPLTFITKELKQHREKILFDQQRALLPAIQYEVEYRIGREPLDKEAKEIKEEIKRLQAKYDEVQKKIGDLVKKRIRSMDPELRRREYGNINFKRDSEPVNYFVRACPNNECRGFLNSKWMCGVCNHYTCSKCHSVKGTEDECDHTCDPNDVSTAELLNKDTKPCPRCGMGIFRIYGCDQMFCTQCNTAFSWKTGEIETRNIHNPHYFDWARRNGTLQRNPNDIICGREITTRFVVTLQHSMDDIIKNDTTLSDSQKKEYTIQSELVSEICRSIIHIREVEIPYYNTKLQNSDNNNRESRILYMMNRICENNFKKRIQVQHKKNQKIEEVLNVFRLMVDTLTDIIYRFSETHIRNNVLDFSVVKEIDEFIQYVHECFSEIKHTYCSASLLVHGLEFIFAKYMHKKRNFEKINNNHFLVPEWYIIKL